MFLSILLFSELLMINSDDTILDNYLFDLYSDPYESVNLYPSWSKSSTHASTIDYYHERSSYWQERVLSPIIPTFKDNSMIWTLNGGVCPWLDDDDDDDDVPVVDTDQIYFTDNPPHIIFVLVDDWGWNDIGLRSSYLSWTTPTIDRLAKEGILLTNYQSHSTCVPSRGALLTGRYSIRLGLWDKDSAVLPLNETTLAQEMKTAGYRTYMVGKWHLGFATSNYLPLKRGFDSFYGFYNGFVDYWTKQYGNFLDLQNNDKIVTDTSESSSSYHNGYLMQKKAEAAISDHMSNYADQPMFLYYSMQLVHSVWSAPQTFLDRCGEPSVDEAGSTYMQGVLYNYCALNVMLDEAITNLTCTLEAYGMTDNTIMVGVIECPPRCIALMTLPLSI
jgi:hypothetical protein